MSDTSRLVQGLLAGIGVFAVDVWPVLLIWRAGSSGSVGDLSEIQFLGISIIYAVVLGVVCGWQMTVALRLVETSPRLGRFDPWGAYALGIGIYSLALTAVPAIMYVLLLADENQSLRDRMWLVLLLWIGGHILAALVGYLASRALLGRNLTATTSDRRHSERETATDITT